MQETLRVKDDEICQLSRDLKSRDLTIKELAGRLSQTAQAAESAASTVYAVENQRKAVLSEVDHLHNELLRVVQKVSVADEHVAAALKSKETALKEAHYWQLELGKAQEQNHILETSLLRTQDCLQQLKAAQDKELTQHQAARLLL
jgi:chromosome segregation ATPase